MDMITCRNLLIYLNSDLQKKIIPIFHYSLNNDGALILGKSESLGDFENSFSIFDSKLKIYNKKSISIPLKYNAIQNLQFIDKNNYSIEKAKTTMSSKKINMSSITDKILLENYAPPSIIVDEKNNAIYYSGNTSQYIESPIGETNLNIIDNAKRGLKSHLELAIQKARASNQLVEIKNIDIKVNNHFKTINLLIKPIFLKEKELSALMVIFENADKLQSSDDINKPIIKDSNKASATAIEKELKITRDHLQTLIDELKTSNEDLQITNEEYQSSNEELQSANEELETSREELQSVNEELITVNTELSEKIEQLSQANDDLDNLLSSTELATVFLDRKLNIKRFTPAATKIFNLIPTDIDRPVTHLSSNILYKALAEDVKQVLKTLIIKSVEVQAIDKTWYYMRILPYRTAENIIEGVLITFIDITTQKKTENKLKNVNENLNMVIDHLPIVPYTCVASNNIKITYVGASSEKVMGFLPDQFINKNTFWINRVHPADRKKIKLLYATIGKKGTMQITFRWKCSDGKYKHFLNYVKHIFSENKNESYIVGMWHEKIMDK
jgi:two-component system CheB/CheR fusion protein